MKTQIIIEETYEKYLKIIFELMQTEIKPGSKNLMN